MPLVSVDYAGCCCQGAACCAAVAERAGLPLGQGRVRGSGTGTPRGYAVAAAGCRGLSTVLRMLELLVWHSAECEAAAQAHPEVMRWLQQGGGD